MAGPYQGLYEGLTFPEYQFREYPKFVQTGEKVDLSTKTTTPTGVLVNSLQEEEAITRPKPPAQPVADLSVTAKAPEAPAASIAPHPMATDPDAELTRLRAQYTKAKGVEPDKRWGAAKLQTVLSNAEGDDNEDPDA